MRAIIVDAAARTVRASELSSGALLALEVAWGGRKDIGEGHEIWIADEADYVEGAPAFRVPDRARYILGCAVVLGTQGAAATLTVEDVAALVEWA